MQAVTQAAIHAVIRAAIQAVIRAAIQAVIQAAIQTVTQTAIQAVVQAEIQTVTVVIFCFTSCVREASCWPRSTRNNNKNVPEADSEEALKHHLLFKSNHFFLRIWNGSF